MVLLATVERFWWGEPKVMEEEAPVGTKPDGPKAAPPLPESYQKARTSYALFSALLASWELIGIELTKLGDYGELKSPEGASIALLGLVLYFGFRISVEWLLAESRSKASRPARWDFWLAHAIGATAVSVFSYQTVSRTQLLAFAEGPGGRSTFEILGVPLPVSALVLAGSALLVVVYVRKYGISRLAHRGRIWAPIPLVVVAILYFPLWRDEWPGPFEPRCSPLVTPWTGLDPVDPLYRIGLSVSSTEGGASFEGTDVVDGGALFVGGEDRNDDGTSDLFVILRPFVQRGPKVPSPSGPSICLEVLKYEPPGRLQPLDEMEVQRVGLFSVELGQVRHFAAPDGRGRLEVKLTSIAVPR